MLQEIRKVDNMDTILITEMTLDDIDDIVEIEKLSFAIPWSRDSFEKELKENRFAIYIVAKLNGKVIGYAGMWKILDEGHITNIAVHPSMRGRKVATGLLDVLISLARSMEIEKMTLEVRETNITAQKLYKNFGFESTGLRKNYYEDNRENALIMWKVV